MQQTRNTYLLNRHLLGKVMSAVEAEEHLSSAFGTRRRISCAVGLGKAINGKKLRQACALPGRTPLQPVLSLGSAPTWVLSPHLGSPPSAAAVFAA